MSGKAATTELRVLVRPSALAGRWVAVCIDRYMVAEGDTPQKAAKALHSVFRAEAAYRKTLDHLPAAPRKYHDEFNEAILPPQPRAVKRDAHVAFEQRLAATPA